MTPDPQTTAIQAVRDAAVAARAAGLDEIAILAAASGDGAAELGAALRAPLPPSDREAAVKALRAAAVVLDLAATMLVRKAGDATWLKFDSAARAANRAAAALAAGGRGVDGGSDPTPGTACAQPGAIQEAAEASVPEASTATEHATEPRVRAYGEAPRRVKLPSALFRARGAPSIALVWGKRIRAITDWERDLGVRLLLAECQRLSPIATDEPTEEAGRAKREILMCATMARFLSSGVAHPEVPSLAEWREREGRNVTAQITAGRPVHLRIRARKSPAWTEDGEPIDVTAKVTR